LTFLGKCDMVLYVSRLSKDNYKLSYQSGEKNVF